MGTFCCYSRPDVFQVWFHGRWRIPKCTNPSSSVHCNLCCKHLCIVFLWKFVHQDLVPGNIHGQPRCLVLRSWTVFLCLFCFETCAQTGSCRKGCACEPSRLAHVNFCSQSIYLH